MTRAWLIGTRASRLARVQSETVAAALRHASGREVELVEISTYGDRSPAPLATIGGTGVFVSALRDALLSGAVDVAVHSYKDLPTAPHDGLDIVAVPPRADPRDALVARDGLTLGELPAGSTVGTGSPRRAAQLRHLGLRAGDRRYPRQCRHPPARSVRGSRRRRRAGAGGAGPDRSPRRRDGDPRPAADGPGAGAGSASRRGRDHSGCGAARRTAHLEDPPSRSTVDAERAVLAALEAGCSAPVGALAVVAEGDDGPEIYLRAVVADVDGAAALRRSATGPVQDAAGLGRRLASELLADGAADIALALAGRAARQGSP